MILILFLMKFWCLLSRNHQKTGLVDLLRVPHPSAAVDSTTPLDFRASGLSASGLVLTCCEFRPRQGNALGIWKRVESLLHKQWNPGATQGWLSDPQGRCVSCEWLGCSVVAGQAPGQCPQSRCSSMDRFNKRAWKCPGCKTPIRYAPE